MRARVAGIVIGLALVAGLMSPSTVAFAGPSRVKAITRFRGLSSEYSIPATHPVDSGATITGKLQYRKWVRRNGKRLAVYAAQNGIVRLYRLSDSTDRPEGVAWTRTSNGSFRFDVMRGGVYLLYYKGNDNRRRSERIIRVLEDSLTLDNFRATSASEDASGGIFVVLSADLAAPPGTLTSATPGVFTLASLSVPLDAEGSTAEPMGINSLFRLIYNIYLQSVPANGTYRLGFTLPEEMRDTTITAGAAFYTGGYYVPKTARTEFKASSLLP